MDDHGKPISYKPTDGLSYDPTDATYWDPAALRKELVRTFEICHGCRLCFKYCDTFPDLFALIDRHQDGDVRAISPEEAERVLDTCFQCKLCDVNCPYTVLTAAEIPGGPPRDGAWHRLGLIAIGDAFSACWDGRPPPGSPIFDARIPTGAVGVYVNFVGDRQIAEVRVDQVTLRGAQVAVAPSTPRARRDVSRRLTSREAREGERRHSVLGARSSCETCSCSSRSSTSTASASPSASCTRRDPARTGRSRTTKGENR